MPYNWSAPILIFVLCASCASSGTLNRNNRDTPPPPWVTELTHQDGELCGVGIAGPGYTPDSRYPRELAEERAIWNLAGSIQTNIAEAIIDTVTLSDTMVEHGSILKIDGALIDTVTQNAATTYWHDPQGVGPFGQAGFTYARSCTKLTQLSRSLNFASDLLQNVEPTPPAASKKRPAWLARSGKQPDGRLCAVGYSAPTFFPERTFENVIEDIRSQLSEVVTTLVSSYSVDQEYRETRVISAMTVASTESVSKGALITHYWYDPLGKGPHGVKRTTYGWGCIYPVNILKRAVASLSENLSPAEILTIDKVKQHSIDAFRALEDLEQSVN